MSAPAVAKPSPIARVKEQFEARQTDFLAALPAHMPVERFMRVVMTAIQRTPDLANADRASLFNASLLAAQDGLLPDGRDGALVIYKTRLKGSDEWVSAVQWMPMIAGVLKKARNSGELSSVEAHIVRAHDDFEFSVGVHDIPNHKPNWFGNRGDVIGVYAFAKLKDGTRQTEIMSIADVEKVRAASKSKDRGPWVDWWEEMAKKTVLRRLLKRLPTSADLDDVIRRDDALYDFDGTREDTKRIQTGSLSSRMAALAKPQPRAPQIDHDPNTGEIQTQDRGASLSPKEAGSGAVPPRHDAPASDLSPAEAGKKAALDGDDRAAPDGYSDRDRREFLTAYDQVMADADGRGEG